MWISFGMSTHAWRLATGHIYDLPVGRTLRGGRDAKLHRETAHVYHEWKHLKVSSHLTRPQWHWINLCHFYSIKNTPSRKHTWLPRWLTSLNFRWWWLSGGRRQCYAMTNLHPLWTASERVSGCKQMWASLLSLCLWMLRLMILLEILFGTVKSF